MLEKDYDISYGIFSNLGVSNAKLIVDYDKREYTAIIEAKTIGIARVLSGNRFEQYKSVGYITDDNTFLPTEFYKITSNNSRYRKTTYLFNHLDNIINVKKEYKKSKDKELAIDSYILDYYATNDILSLFFNLKNILTTLKTEKEYDYIAVGSDKNQGIITLKVLNNLDSEMELMVYLNQPIFSSKRGELNIQLDGNGLCKQALLKDVLLFGDIIAK